MVTFYKLSHITASFSQQQGKNNSFLNPCLFVKILSMKQVEKIIKERLEKVERFRKNKADPYPSKVKPHQKIDEVISDFHNFKKRKLVLVGRIKNIRKHGGSTFLHFEDSSGCFQAYLKKDKLGQNSYRFFLKNFDIGDFVLFEGKLMLTKKGEKTIEVDKYQILAKCIYPLPEKWHGLQDVEERFRKRYLDLLMNPEVRKKFLLRSRIISETRKFLEKNGFIEVETPILQKIAGGAAAKPFETHHKTLDINFYLRIAPELYLKKLLIGGFEKIFEIGRVFRNEGIDASHNPDFTSLEFYWAYARYEDVMELLQKMLERLVEDIFGKKQIKYQKDEIDFTPPFERIEFYDFLTEKIGADPEKLNKQDIKRIAKDFKINIEKKSRAKILDDIFKRCRGEIIKPTFVLHQPIELTPLARASEKKVKRAARLQLIIAGWEIANGFNELTDPLEQKRRFENQRKEKSRGDIEAHPFDEEYIQSLKYGMPPAVGLGMGIDRLVAVLTDSKKLRDVILFPLMKPEK